jgi:hypothetical protein
MTKATAALVGLFTAPLIAAVILWVWPELTEKYPAFPGLLGLLVVYFLSVVWVTIFGAPIFFLFLYFKLVRWWSAIAGGFVTGALMPVLLHLPYIASVQEILSEGSVGAISGLGFWLIWRRGRESAKHDEDVNQGSKGY